MDWEEKERERQTDRQTLMWKTPTGSLPHVPRPGLQPETFWCPGRHSDLLSHPARTTAHF